METKKNFTKKSNHSEENNLLQAKKSLGFVKHFIEFAKGIDETYNPNFFHLAVFIAAVEI